MLEVKVRGTLREERADLTRRRIIGAARALFASKGYGATTLAEIAAGAGVAVQTVYAVYRSKAGVLAALREGVVHDAEAERLFKAAVAEPSGTRKLELFASSIRTRWEHSHDVVAIHAAAAATDPRLRGDLEIVLGRRRGGILRFSQTLKPQLRRDVDVGRAAAIIDALTLPEIYAELVNAQRWTPATFELWLAETLKHQVLRAPPGAAARS